MSTLHTQFCYQNAQNAKMKQPMGLLGLSLITLTNQTHDWRVSGHLGEWELELVACELTWYKGLLLRLFTYCKFCFKISEDYSTIKLIGQALASNHWHFHKTNNNNFFQLIKNLKKTSLHTNHSLANQGFETTFLTISYKLLLEIHLQFYTNRHKKTVMKS